MRPSRSRQSVSPTRDTTPRRLPKPTPLHSSIRPVPSNHTPTSPTPLDHTRLSTGALIRCYHQPQSPKPERRLTLNRTSVNPSNPHCSSPSHTWDSTPSIKPSNDLNSSSPIAHTLDQSSALPRLPRHRHQNHRTVNSLSSALPGQPIRVPPRRTTSIHSRPRFHSLGTISNLNPECTSTKGSHHLSFSSTPMFETYDQSNDSLVLKGDLVSRQLWAELEAELGEKIQFPLDEIHPSRSHSPDLSSSSIFNISDRITPNSSSTDSFQMNYSQELDPHTSTPSLKFRPTSHTKPTGDLPKPIIRQSQSVKGFASELRQSIMTPKPKRPTGPAPPELLSQIPPTSPASPNRLDAQVRSARTALHKARPHLDNIDESMRGSPTSDFSLSAIFGLDTDSTHQNDHTQEHERRNQETRLSPRASPSPQIRSNPKNESRIIPRSRYLSGASTDSEIEVTTPNENIQSIASSSDGHTLPLDSIQMEDVDQILQSPDLLDSWAPQTNLSSSINPTRLGVQPSKCLPRATKPPVLQLGHQYTFHPLSPERSRLVSHSISPRLAHASKLSMSSIASTNGSSQRGRTRASTVTTSASSDFGLQKLSLPSEHHETRSIKSQSAPVALRPKVIRHSRTSSLASQASAPPNPTRPFTSTEKSVMRHKRSASASASKHSPLPSTFLPEIPIPNPSLKIPSGHLPHSSPPTSHPIQQLQLLSSVFTLPTPPQRSPPPPLPELPPQLSRTRPTSPVDRSSHPSSRVPTRPLRPRHSQPQLTRSSSSTPHHPLSVCGPLLRPPAPAPLNLSPTSSPPPSPDRFKFPSLSASTAHSHSKDRTARLLSKVQRDLFSSSSSTQPNHRTSAEKSEIDRGGSVGNRLRSRSFSSKINRGSVGSHRRTPSIPGDVPKSTFED